MSEMAESMYSKIFQEERTIATESTVSGVTAQTWLLESEDLGLQLALMSKSHTVLKGSTQETLAWSKTSCKSNWLFKPRCWA